MISVVTMGVCVCKHSQILHGPQGCSHTDCSCLRYSEPIADPVNRPRHYTSRDIEVIDIIEAWEMNFHLGNVVKYVLRHKEKNGLEDLKKARWYLDREITKQEKGK